LAYKFKRENIFISSKQSAFLRQNGVFRRKWDISGARQSNRGTNNLVFERNIQQAGAWRGFC
jgi:hypothetical protein